MKCLAIRNWETLFEVAQSRKVAEMKWVAVPTRHDGESFRTIMAHKDGGIIYTTWILLLQIAAKAKPRGHLLRGIGLPHTMESLSIKTGAPAQWFETAIDYLTEHTDWLESRELAEPSQQQGTATSLESQVPPSVLPLEHQRATSAVELNPATEQNRTEQDITMAAPKGASLAFDDFWFAYPRKVAKASAKKVFLRHGLHAHIEEILIALKHQALSKEWTKDRGEYIPHPATWLNGRRWEDEINTTSGSAKPGTYEPRNPLVGCAP